MGKGIVKLGEGNWAVKDGNLLAAKETNNRFKNAEFTVTRGTDATYVGKDGLIKTASFYNLLPYSEDFEYPNWSNNTIDFQHGYESPTGSNTATKITATGTDPYVYKYVDVTQNQAYTFSFYCKGEGSSLGKTARVLFWYGAGTATGSTTSHEFNLTSDWERIQFQTTPTASGTLPFRIDIPANTSEVGDVAYIWGAQLVEGTEALDYQYTNGKEGIPRIDFTNNTDGHLLLEPESRNLITYSEDFSVWNKNGATTTPNDSISPSGILNAAKLKPTKVSGVHLIDFNVTSSNVKTYSVFAKQNGYTRLRFNTGSSSNGFASFNLSNGSVAASGGTYYSSSNIEDYGNGWYRCSVTFLANAPNNFTIVVEDSSAQVTFVGDGVSSIYIWGAQVEEQSYVTSYIPTNGGQVTRDADLVQRESINEIDIPQEEGTIYLELKGYEKNTEIFNFDRSTSNSIHVGTDSNGVLKVWGYYEPSGTETSLQVTLSANTSKVAIAFKNGSFIVYADGEEELNTSTFVWTPTDSIDRLYFNRGGYVASQGLSKVKALRIYKEAFNTTQLDELTS